MAKALTLVTAEPDHTLTVLALVGFFWFALPGFALFFVSTLGGAVVSSMGLASLLFAIFRFATTPPGISSYR